MLFGMVSGVGGGMGVLDGGGYHRRGRNSYWGRIWGTLGGLVMIVKTRPQPFNYH